MECCNKDLSSVDRWVGTFERDTLMPIEGVARCIPFVAQPILGTAQIVASVALIIIFSLLGTVTSSKNCWDIVFHATRHLGHGCLNLLTIISDALIFGLILRIPSTSDNPWIFALSYQQHKVDYQYALLMIKEERDNDQETRRALTEMQNDINYQLLSQCHTEIRQKIPLPAGQLTLDSLIDMINKTKIEEIPPKDYYRISKQIRNKSIMTYFNMESGLCAYPREVKVEELIKYFLFAYKREINPHNSNIYPSQEKYNESERWLGRSRSSVVEHKEVHEDLDRLKPIREALDNFKRHHSAKIEILERLAARARPIALSVDLEIRFFFLYRLLNTNLEELKNAPEETLRTIEDLIVRGVFRLSSGGPNNRPPIELSIVECMETLIAEYTAFIQSNDTLITNYENRNLREAQQRRDRAPRDLADADDCND